MRNFWGLLGPPGGLMRSPRASWVSWGSRSILEPPGASWGRPGLAGVSWGFLAFPGISWGLLGPPEAS
eukprot:1935916-Pyramimonas_sp.AAC.1